MPQNLEKPKFLLAELFQLDCTELDFGIYRFSEKQPLAEENGELIIRFECWPDSEIRKSEVV